MTARSLNKQSAQAMIYKRWGITFTGNLRHDILTLKIRGTPYTFQGPHALDEMKKVIQNYLSTPPQ